MTAGLRAILRSGVVTFIVLGAGAVFVILGIAGVSLRANCYEAGLCVDAEDSVITGSVSLVPEAEAATPEFEVAAAPKEPETRATRLRAAGTLIAATFDSLMLEPDASVAVEPKGEAEAAAVASVEADDEPPPTLTKRVVKSVPVTAEGQPVWTTPGNAAPANAVVARRQVASLEPVPEVAPAEAASDVVAPVPAMRPAHLQERSAKATPATEPKETKAAVEVAEAEPAAQAEPPTSGADLRVVKGQGVNVRAGPSSSQGKLFALPGGRRVTVIGQQRGWLQIIDDQGRTGWVYKNYLSSAG